MCSMPPRHPQPLANAAIVAHRNMIGVANRTGKWPLPGGSGQALADPMHTPTPSNITVPREKNQMQLHYFVSN